MVEQNCRLMTRDQNSWSFVDNTDWTKWLKWSVLKILEVSVDNILIERNVKEMTRVEIFGKISYEQIFWWDSKF